MEIYSGIAAFQGVAAGKIVELKKEENPLRRRHVSDSESEKHRFLKAKDEAIEQLTQLYEKAVKEVGEVNAAIFQVHQMMLDDDGFLESVVQMIETQSVNAEYAVAVTGDNFLQKFASMDDEYMKERGADVKDISERLIKILTGNEEQNLNITEPSVIVADDLVPSQTVQLDKEKVLALVTRRGSVNSHTAILAGTMNIPAIVSSDIPEGVHGKMVIVNGYSGQVIVDPDEEELKVHEELKNEEEEKKKLLQQFKAKPTMTKSGKSIKLYANIGGVSDIDAVLQNGADGIGLFRSEFLYLQEEDYPSEEKQFQSYKQVAEMMAGRQVIIRTLDIGADKQIEYFKLDKEENPALGFRAIRICLTRKDIFKTQLRALYRAGVYGNIAVMIPMIISEWEVKKVKEIMAEVRNELEAEGIPFTELEFGIMIETPAAVMIAEELAKEVDFFSIGTNDLTQYTLAIDRQNQNLDMFYDSHHPAVMKMIQMVIDVAHKAGIWAGICGELGADTKLTQQFIRMGIDELSVSPGMILSVRKEICEMDIS